MTNQKYIWTDNPTVSGVSKCDTDVLNDCLMHLKYENNNGDGMPLFYNFYSKEDMTTTGAYVNASLGSWLSGNIYTTAYQELVNKLGTDNVKANTDTYTDYDFVVNQGDMSFRLPLKNGNEDLADWENAVTITAPYTASENGYITGYASTQGDVYYRINGVLVGETAGTGSWASRGNIQVLVKKGDVFTLQNNPTDGTSFNFVPAKGNGNLYYKLSNAVTNLELLDVAKVTADLNTKISKTECPAYIVETYQNGTSWYRVWSDGWCEQGGMVIQGTGTSSYFVTYLVEMKDINYTAQVSPIIAENDDTGGDASDIAIICGGSTGNYPYGKSTTQLRLSTYSNAKNGFNWEVKGYKK